MARRVLDCPFCGAAAKVWTRVAYDRRVREYQERTTVLCTSCGCRTTACGSPGLAIEAWNRRRGGHAVPAAGPWWKRLFGG